MRDIIDIRGASAQVYRFTRFRVGNPLSAMGGNFVYARDRGTNVELLYVGETQNLLTGARVRWDEAVRDHGAEDIFTRLNISEGVRLREHADILAGADIKMRPSEDGGAA